ncbi:chaperone DnaJ domain protein [Senna tora]|uniref:Chaperone DnaJ domain protein n=1 Tax=Senna tora TaxID=362788 RepID=A0A834X819_9FABA|nr:chaperone DnaJ domain protein [Senna tora]
MQSIRWRNLLSLKTRILPATPPPSTSSAFHSTPCLSQKSKNKSNTDARRNKKPSKNHIRFVTREKRADAKKALKDLLYNSGSSSFSSQEGAASVENISAKFSWIFDSELKKETIWKLKEDRYWCGDEDDHSDSHENKGQPKSRRKFGKSQKKTKGKIRRESFCEDFDGHPETIFHATFGNRSSTWSFCDWRGSSFGNSTSGFDHRREREHSNWTNRSNTRNRKWINESDAETEDDDVDSCCSVGLLSDRTILGLPPSGPLKIEDVKNAFRLSALKWHPDKHQGPSQAVAEEKFKLCVNAYKSLCSAISPAA